MMKHALVSRRIMCNRVPRYSLRVRAVSLATQEFLDATYLVGKSIMLFVGFYCGLQWLHYRQMIDEKDDDKK